MSLIAIIDIDTTLANNDHRAKLLSRTCVPCGSSMSFEHRPICPTCGSEKYHTPQQAWDQFMDHELMLKDEPQPHALAVLQAMRSHGWELVFMTGRNERHRGPTSTWLYQHMGKLSHEKLLMRPEHMPDVPASQMKEQMFLEFRREVLARPSRTVEGRYLPNMYVFFEDDRYVLGTWKKYGIVFKCPEAWETMNPEIFERHIEPGWNR